MSKETKPIYQLARRIDVPLRRKVRLASRSFTAHPYRVAGEVLVAASVGITLVASGRAAVDAISEKNKTTWLAAPLGSCVGTIFFGAHTVTSGENVALHIQPFEGDPNGASSSLDETIIDMSGTPIEVGGRVICFSDGVIAKKGLIYQTTNTNERGEAQGSKGVYTVSP